MPPLSGQVIMNNGPIVATWFWNPDGMLDSRPLRNNPNPWTDPYNVTWPANTGAFMGLNKTSTNCRLRVSNTLGALMRSISMPANTDTVIPVATLILGGLFLDARDFNGASFEMI